MTPVQGFGPLWLPHGGARFRLFAPARRKVQLRLESRTGARAPACTMERNAEGWHWLDCPGCEPGDCYAFDLGDGLIVPDPASRRQPRGVHGPSEIVDLQAYAWRTPWRGRPWHEAVIYELHVGTFSSGGDYAGVEQRLDYLQSLGITALELMPVAQFAGHRGWGYDGVLPFAPHCDYGTPAQLQALVDAAHARGLMVLLDVVYNHFGPEGHYIPRYWPHFVNPEVHTPWGAAVNYDAQGAAEVRSFVLDNAAYWLREFRLDGLRFDAVHAIHDRSPRPLLREVAERLRREFAGRELHLVIENERNDAQWLDRDGDAAGTFSAQWNDDVHHGLHTALTGESEGYYVDFAPDRALLPRALATGFAWQGEVPPSRQAPRGTPSGGLRRTAFVDFLQNHDQVGNRATGERIAKLAPAEARQAALAILLLSPHVPLLFMGEEWGTQRPFLYFCDFAEPLASAIRNGRRREFSHFAAFRDETARDRLPDPLSESTFEASCLDWREADAPESDNELALVRKLLALRHVHVAPWLVANPVGEAEHRNDGSAFHVRWAGTRRDLHLQANLGAETATMPAPGGADTLFERGRRSGDRFEPWTVRWSWS